MVLLNGQGTLNRTEATTFQASDATTTLYPESWTSRHDLNVRDTGCSRLPHRSDTASPYFMCRALAKMGRTVGVEPTIRRSQLRDYTVCLRPPLIGSPGRSCTRTSGGPATTGAHRASIYESPAHLSDGGGLNGSRTRLSRLNRALHHLDANPQK
jgi:hypothetical protein